MFVFLLVFEGVFKKCSDIRVYILCFFFVVIEVCRHLCSALKSQLGEGEVFLPFIFVSLKH